MAHANAVHESARLDAPQHLGVEEVRRRLERFLIQEPNRFRLAGFRNRSVNHAGLIGILLVPPHAADDDGDVVHLEAPLPYQPIIQVVQQIVVLELIRGGGR